MSLLDPELIPSAARNTLTSIIGVQPLPVPGSSPARKEKTKCDFRVEYRATSTVSSPAFAELRDPKPVLYLAGPRVTVILRVCLDANNVQYSLEFTALSSRDKTLHLTPRATESGYEHTQTKILARTLARTF